MINNKYLITSFLINLTYCLYPGINFHISSFISDLIETLLVIQFLTRSKNYKNTQNTLTQSLCLWCTYLFVMFSFTLHSLTHIFNTYNESDI